MKTPTEWELFEDWFVEQIKPSMGTAEIISLEREYYKAWNAGRAPLLSRIAELEQELVEARKDTARLDWLALPDNEIGYVHLPPGSFIRNRDNLRAAIDDAMTGTKPAE